MTIAVTSQDRKTITGHAGKCRKFWIYDISVARGNGIPSEFHATCEEEKSVSKIVEELGATQSNISRHLTLMCKGGLLTRRKEGNQVYYVSADPEMVENLRQVCIRLATQMDPRTPMRGEFLRRLHEQVQKRKERAG
ncbi:MAG: ArsR family transcriptional regulator [Proteobacteria bacterium]|nr:ArsR family transcriptional regulator [Pseudomonadota bacterium]